MTSTNLLASPRCTRPFLMSENHRGFTEVGQRGGAHPAVADAVAAATIATDVEHEFPELAAVRASAAEPWTPSTNGSPEPGWPRPRDSASASPAGTRCRRLAFFSRSRRRSICFTRGGGAATFRFRAPPLVT